MQITTRVERIWSDRQQRYILLGKKSRKWTGPVAYAKGASAQQTDLANQQANFYKTMTQDYNKQFANQSNILSSLNKSLSPILSGGINQYGFSPAEEAALNAQAIQGTAGQYASANRALREEQAAQGGGNQFLPSGANAAQQAAVNAAGAANTSNQLLGIKQAGYQQGRQNYLNAVGALQNVSSQYNPLGYAGQSTGAGDAAFGSATKVAEMNNAASPWNVVGGILGGAVGAGLNAFTGGIGGTLAKSVMGG